MNIFKRKEKQNINHRSKAIIEPLTIEEQKQIHGSSLHINNEHLYEEHIHIRKLNPYAR